jgi:hypothetical protein
MHRLIMMGASPPNSRPRLHFLALVVAASAAAHPARADEGARPTARAIAEQGDAQFYAGRCDNAIALWRKADAVYHAPTIVLRIARCQALLGKVVAAASSLQTLVSEPRDADAPPAFAAAREAGERELPRVRARIAYVRVDVRSSRADVPVTIEIDGTPVDASRSVPLDPGTHRVSVAAGGATWAREVQLGDGEARAIEVPLVVDALPTVPRAQRNAGLAVFGAGTLALAAGIGFSVAALSLGRSLDAVCGSGRAACPPSAQGDINRARTYSIAADGVLIGGAVLVVTAGVLLTANLRVGSQERVRLTATPRGAMLAGEL